MSTRFNSVAVVGAGAMGRGIAQIAAQAGSQVLLYDSQPQACRAARDTITAQWGKLAEKGRLTPEQVQQHTRRLQCVDSLQALADCDLVIEAIVERLDIKQSVFAELESVVRADTVLASNTSSLSVTAIAAKLQHPQRVAGYHFFNPVPLMKVVEVIPGLKTDPAVCQRLQEYARELSRRRAEAATRMKTPAPAAAPERRAARD